MASADPSKDHCCGITLTYSVQGADQVKKSFIAEKPANMGLPPGCSPSRVRVAVQSFVVRYRCLLLTLDRVVLSRG
jgi:hypothetical protein